MLGEVGFFVALHSIHYKACGINFILLFGMILGRYCNPRFQSLIFDHPDYFFSNLRVCDRFKRLYQAQTLSRFEVKILG